ncbi:PREDICTED: uncharacterized protein LOC106323314 [Brassica oleracea var. oleracea]|uniref:uncharacterized protein LOC106323314 n=1 Tax=Brassica oleracea var. oleracea TaxID=109376 RepID=UPI0006A74677|nr:PREDICTED: uncharacterized protein LOC106323314 [Brassica oleracea var. oleracea]
MRNFDYGSDEAVQESKKGGELDASMSLSSPERSRIRKKVEGISMLASTETSKTRRGTSYGSPASSPRQSKKQKLNSEKSLGDDGDDKEEFLQIVVMMVGKMRTVLLALRNVPPRQSKKQKLNSEKSLGDDGDDKEEFLQIVVNEEEEFGDIGDDGREDENSIAGIEEVGCTDLSLYFGDKAKNDDCEVDEDEGDDDAWDDDKIHNLVSSDDENEEEMIPAQAYREDTDPEELLQLGKTFSDAEDFKHACLRYTLKTRYNIKYYRSSSLKMGPKCAAEMRDDEAPCPWIVYCSYDRRKQKLMVKTYVNDHKCERTGYFKILKRSVIASLFAERLRLNPKLTAKEIQAEILREYKMEVLENSCIKAKTKVMKERRKTHEEHFDKIWDYQAEILRSNPGSTMEIETIPGATGQLLAAVGIDGDNRIVPIAWALVEIENDTNWDWFVKRLALDLGLEDGNSFIIMSDKQKGLVKAVHTLLPEAEHRQCCRHIYENWRKGGKDLRLQRFFWFIARSYTPGMFNYNMDELKNYDPGAHASLIKTKPKTWSRAFFKIGSYCNDNLDNLCESFNKTIREPRKKPLLDMSEEIRHQCMTRNYNRSKMAKDMKTRFTQKTHKELDKVKKKSKECSLRWAIGPETEVEDKDQAYVVNLENETCACRSWQMNGIPCIHAAKVILGVLNLLLLATQPLSGVKPTILGSDM